MAQFRFSGDPKAPGTDPESCELFGIVFPLDEPVEVENEAIAKRLRTHTHFTEVGSEKDQAAPPKKRGRPPSQHK